MSISVITITIIIIFCLENVDAWANCRLEDARGNVTFHNLFAQRFIPKRAVTFQNYVSDDAMSLFFAKMGAIDKKKVKIIIMERSLYTNPRIFAQQLLDQGKIDQLEFLLLMKKGDDFFNIMVDNFDLQPVFIHLYDNVSASLDRLRKRNRRGEEICGENLLRDLDFRYKSMFANEKFPFRTLNINLEEYRSVVKSEREQPVKWEGECDENLIDLDRIIDYIVKTLSLSPTTTL